MEKEVYFREEFERNSCYGQVYFDFIDYAFSKADYFMLVFVNYYGNGYKSKQKYFMDKLKKYKVKTRTNPYWLGTPGTFSQNSTYKIVFYKTEPDAKEILKEVDGISAWSRPGMPEDLAFFKKNQCWFYSVGHEHIASMQHIDTDDLDFLESKKLASKKDVLVMHDEFLTLYDEQLEK